MHFRNGSRFLHSQTCKKIARSFGFKVMTRHTDVEHHFVWEQLSFGKVNSNNCNTSNMLDNFLPKPSGVESLWKGITGFGAMSCRDWCTFEQPKEWPSVGVLIELGPVIPTWKFLLSIEKKLDRASTKGRRSRADHSVPRSRWATRMCPRILHMHEWIDGLQPQMPAEELPLSRRSYTGPIGWNLSIHTDQPAQGNPLRIQDKLMRPSIGPWDYQYLSQSNLIHGRSNKTCCTEKHTHPIPPILILPTC